MTTPQEPAGVAELFAAASVEFFAKLRAELNQTLRTERLRGDVPKRFTGSMRATTVANTFMGFAVTETSGTTPAVVSFYDNGDNSDHFLFSVTLAAGESTRETLTARGISLVNGLFVEVTSGAVKGSVFLGSA